MDNKASVMGWFIGGAILGAAVALLLAPEPGTRTRRKLASQAERSRKTIIESGQEILEKGRELYEKGLRVADEAADLIERGRRIVEG